ncbi:MAG: DUF2304 domain-containing protein [Spirochaetes bacterium]|nr:DUF2304 domain-containing protein [Spirochaetota bacterium]
MNSAMEKVSLIQILGIAGSTLFLFLIIELIRKKKIKEEYSLLWLFFGIIFLVISIWRDSLEYIALLLGIAYAPAAIFLILIIAIISILIHYSLVISRLTENVKNLTQAIGLLDMELNETKKELIKSKTRTKQK